GVSNPLVWHQLQILTTEGVALAGGEVRERHPVGTAYPGIQLVHLAGEPIGRQPLDHRVRIQECPIDPFGRSPEDTVKTDGARHGLLSCRWLASEPTHLVGSTGSISTASPTPNSRPWDTTAQRPPHSMPSLGCLNSSCSKHPAAG